MSGPELIFQEERFGNFFADDRKKSELPEIRTLAKDFASLPISSTLQGNSGLGRVAAAAVVIVVSVDAAADDEEDVENQMR